MNAAITADEDFLLSIGNGSLHYVHFSGFNEESICGFSCMLIEMVYCMYINL